MKKILSLKSNLSDKIGLVFLRVTVFFIVLALINQISFVLLYSLGREELLKQANTWFIHNFDGNFNKNETVSPIEEKTIWVESVTNNVKIGNLAGNRQLEFGVKNVLEEYLQDKGFDITPNSPYKLQVQIIFLDVLTIKKNVSVFHKNEEEVVIRMKGILSKNGKKVKELLVEESSSEISMSTLIIDQGGKFNQTSLSNALKKSADKLITKLFE